MGIDFGTEFNKNSNSATFGWAPRSGASSRQDKPKCKVWLNLGVPVEGKASDGSDRFVSLPVGLPLDTMEPVKVQSNNVEHSQLQAARNDLLDQLQALGNQLQPGEDMIISIPVQIRRVKDESAPVAADESNPFSVKLNIVQAD